MEEPVRESYLHIVKRNLSLADRLGNITRFLYIGEYNGTKENVQKKIGGTIKQLNEEYGEIIITGLLLVYPRFFIHLVEASENIIYRHLQGIFSDDSEKLLGRIVPLPAHHSIYKLYFSDWYEAFVANPPVLLDKIEKSNLDEIKKQIANFLFEMYSLSEYLMDEGEKSIEKTRKLLKYLDKNVPDFLPEITTVEYLLSVKSPVLKDLREYYKAYIRIPFINLYKDRIWPPPLAFTPCSPFSQRVGES